MTTVVRDTELQTMLTDMLTTAAEGGIGYWSAATEYRWDCPPVERHISIVDAESVGDDEADDVLDRRYDDDAEFQWLSVGLLGIELAMQRCARANVDPVPYLSEHTSKLCRQIFLWLDAGLSWLDCDASSEFDAHTADEILQVAALGKVVYG